jgi:hypothetical protein
MFLPHHSDSHRDGPASVWIDIQQEAERRLHSSCYAALKDVGCKYERGELHLHGHLATHYLKQIAQALVADVEGVRIVINQIAVGVPVRGAMTRPRERPDRTNDPCGTPEAIKPRWLAGPCPRAAPHLDPSPIPPEGPDDRNPSCPLGMEDELSAGIREQG